MNRVIALQKTGNAALLIAGTAIGAGMLALPVLTAQAGFWPAMLLFALCAGLMACTGLLTIDACERVPGRPNLLSLAGATLGRSGRWITWIVYLGLFYSLLVAYQAAAGDIFAGMSQTPPLTGRLLLAAGALVAVNLGTGAVQRINSILMVGLIVTYLLFITVGLPHVRAEPLSRAQWPMALIAMPVAFTAFGFQGVLPSLVAHMEGQLHLLRRAIWLGLALVLLVYGLWELVVLTVVPLDGLTTALANGQSAVAPLQGQLQASWLSTAGQFFGLFAIVTSYLGVSLGLTDFLRDGLRKGHPVLLGLLVQLPPLLITFTSPYLFLSALKYGGGFGSAILLALLPIAMAWKQDARKGLLLACLALVAIDIAIEITQLIA
jgi:tyrosine-specific transport protein